MKKDKARQVALLRAPHSAELSLQVGRANLAARVQVTNAGLLAVGAMVSGILLSTAALVYVAARAAEREGSWQEWEDN